MQYLVSVIDDGTGRATPTEEADIDADGGFDGGRAGRIGREGSISKVLDDDGVGAALFQGQQVTAGEGG